MKNVSIFIVLSVILTNSWSQNCDTSLFPEGKQYYDTYHHVAGEPSDWMHYNTHDPTVYKDGEWFYMYSTDASWANIHNTGALKRRSKDLVNWEFLGTAFDGVPQSAVDFFKNNGNPDYTDNGIWAPFLHKYKNTFYLYYSAPGLEGVNFAYIGYATSDSAGGPWEDRGMITTSNSTSSNDSINAIDPAVVYDSINKKLWMTYGSWESGLYILELDTATGGIKTPGDRGIRIAARNGGLEGPEITYRNGWYYLFVSYDPLGDIYNVRVGRSRNADGPYYDINGVNMADYTDNIPLIQAPYKFNNHPGWQGTAHCGVYNDNGTYYMFNQGRPSIESAMMVLHVRKIFWINDWPVVSPERYAGVPQCSITEDSLVGKWEHLLLIHRTGGSFHNTSESLELHADGSFNSSTTNSWTLDGDTLTLSWNNGQFIDRVIVSWGWDWENRCKTILYTGMNTDGLCMWGKKINQKAVDNYTILISGAAYVIRSLYSHMVMELLDGKDEDFTSIRQGVDNGQSSQLWRLISLNNGYYKLRSLGSQTGRVMEVFNGYDFNGNDIKLKTSEPGDKQQFNIYYNNNGYYHILTKVSNNLSCLDLYNFSVEQGGNIVQWEYLGGRNQFWRFEKVDTVAIVNLKGILHRQPDIQLYPNPGYNGYFILNLEGLNRYDITGISVHDNSGTEVYNMRRINYPEQYLNLQLPAGIYIIKVVTKQKHYIEKLIIL
ncbi:MAG: family 43 glycosylhydrolase [Bacteroidales bacterium]|nr:MAG: family 43 glycosylhydrolase [Bacteroidales bacterium]